jgi:putative oxidoreductase
MSVLLENVVKLLEMNIGDRGRLDYIKDTLEKQNQLFTSDRLYVKKLSKQLIPLDTAQNSIDVPESKNNREVIQLKNRIKELEDNCETKPREFSIRKLFTTPPRQNFTDIGILFARFGLGFTFLWAGFGKLTDPAGVGMMLQNMMGVSEQMSMTVATVIGSLEFLTGILLLIGLSTRPSALFTIVILLGSLAMFGLDFGMGPAIWKDPAMIGMAVLLFLYGSGKFGIDAKLGLKK